MSDPITAKPSVARRLAAHHGTRQVSKFTIVGTSNTVLDTAIYTSLILAGGGYIISKLAATIAATLSGFMLNQSWTFRAGDFEIGQLGRYALVQGIGFTANIGILAALVEGADLGPLVAQILSLPAVAAVSFLAHKHWTFRPPLREPEFARD